MWMNLERSRLSHTPLEKLEDNNRGHLARFYDIHFHKILGSTLPEGTKTQNMIADKLDGILSALKTSIDQRVLVKQAVCKTICILFHKS